MHGSHIRRFALALASLGLLLLALVPAAVGAAYPPNTVISNTFDPRFCGDGQVSVVSDQNSNLIDVCTTTGQRFDPTAYGYGYAPGFGIGAFPTYNAGGIPPVYGAAGNAPVVRQHNDSNSNCPNGDVIETTAGFYCTANGQPAASSLSIPAFNGGFVPTATNGFVPTYTTGGVPTLNYGSGVAPGFAGGTVIRQYNDGRSNCPNGDVTETVTGFFCTANGQPAARVN
ncbi:MAG: hypothetical protein ACR2JW_17505 [Thermomicrobiales bacterium]